MATSFLFKAHAVHTDYAGPMLWPLEQATEVMQWYREFIVQAPENIAAFSPSWSFHRVRLSRSISISRRCVESFGATLDLWKRPKESSNPFAPSVPRRSTLWAPYRTLWSRACSTLCIHPVCNGIGRLTSSKN